jgi:hypothetical protein
MAESLGPCMLVALASAATFAQPEVRTLVMCWHSDLVGFIESEVMATRLYALQHVKTEIVGGRPVLSVREVVEIWRGLDTSAEGAEVIVFKAAEGSSFCGVEGDAVPTSVRLEHLLVELTGPSMAS